MKKFLKMLAIIAISTVALTGCMEKEDKEYSTDGLTITMEDGMVKKDILAANIYYEGQKVVFSAIKETFETLEQVEINKDSTIGEYLDAVMAANKSDYEILKDDGLIYFTYEKEVSERNFYYLSSVVKGNDAFWLTTFACESKNKAEYALKFIEWSKTIKVDQI